MSKKNSKTAEILEILESGIFHEIYLEYSKKIENRPLGRKVLPGRLLIQHTNKKYLFVFQSF